MTDAPPNKLAYTIREAVAATGLSRATLYRLANAGEIALAKIGGRTLIRRAHIEAMLEKAERTPLDRPRAA